MSALADRQLLSPATVSNPGLSTTSYPAQARGSCKVLLRTCLTHSQITDSRHECFRTFAGASVSRRNAQIHWQHGQIPKYHIFLASMSITSAAAFSFYRLFLACFFIEVQELVWYPVALRDVEQLPYDEPCCFRSCCWNCTSFQCSIETACLFYGKEEFPRLFGDRHSQVLDIIRTGSWVYHFQNESSSFSSNC